MFILRNRWARNVYMDDTVRLPEPNENLSIKGEVMINSLRKIPIRLRLTSLVVFFSLGLICVVYLSLTVNKQSLLDEKYAQTKNVVETATGVFNYFYQLEQSGEISRSDAQRYAMSMIKDTRYAKSEYFWINDYNAVMVMHSVNPALDGKDLSNLEDPNGKNSSRNL